MTIVIKNKFSDDRKVYVCLELDKTGYYKTTVSEDVCNDGLYYQIASSQDYYDRKKAIKAFYGYCHRYISKR